MIRSVMYHYVQEYSNNLRGLKFLNVDDFEKQLDFFEKEYGFLDRDEFLEGKSNSESTSGIVLTFDDGLLCHYKYVYPILKRRGLWGIFYINTGPLTDNIILDVHRIHLLLASCSLPDILEFLVERIDSTLLEGNLPTSIKNGTYKYQNSNDLEKTIKRIFNYHLGREKRKLLLDEVFVHFELDEIFTSSNYYLNYSQLKEMENEGMVIGAHTRNHNLLSSLSYEEQASEIIGSINDLISENLKVETFCFPYGGPLSYNNDTIKILTKAAVKYCFTVESRVISEGDSHLELPRFDCNEFPYGKCYKPL